MSDVNLLEDDFGLLRERFGDSVEVVFDGTPESCPICHGEVAQLRLELEPLEAVVCNSCGAVLVA